MRNSLCLYTALYVYFASGIEVTISNTVPRRDTDGDIISAGDGCISYQPDEQLYYLFGAHYQPCLEPNTDCYSGKTGEHTCSRTGFVAEGECCGWRNTTIASWSSPDLITWKKEGLNILPLATAIPASPLSSNYGAIFEPCGVYNRKTRFWTLFFLRDGYTLASAVARTASGPFSVVQWSVPVPGFATIVDFYFWQSLDGTLIMKHNGGGGESAVILSDDYLSISNSSSIFGKELGYTEGGGIFQHGDSTYVMAGYGCCFCTLGSNGFLWQSSNGVLGPYTLLGDFVPYNPDHSSITHSQQFSVTPVYTSSGVQPMFIGVRFGSAPDFRKDHDYQYWFPLTFNETNGVMKNVSWIDSFTLDLAVPVVPPLPPPPPATWFSCSFDVPGTCFEVPAGAPGARSSLSDCEAACVPEYVCSNAVTGGQCVAVPTGIIPGASTSCSIACAPTYICSLTTPGVCESAPPGTPGALPSLAECQQQCVLCNLAGVWVGQENGINITITQQPINSTTASVTISVPPGVWPSSATGHVELSRLSVTGGWCGSTPCSGVITPLVSGGPQCAEITWEAGSWCLPALDPLHCAATV